MEDIKALKISSLSGLNKGDYIISVCLEHLFKINGVQITSIDIENRSISTMTEARGNNAIRKFIRSNIYLKYITKTLKLKLKIVPKIVNKAEDFDLIVIGGGNMLFNESGCPYLYYFSKLASKLHKKRFLFYAVGVGPFDLPYKKQLTNILSKSNNVLVRDEYSRAILSSCCNGREFEIAVDPAFILSDIYGKCQSKKDFIAFNFIDFQVMAFNKENCNEESLVRNIIDISEHFGLKIMLIVTSGQDINITKRIKNEIEKQGRECRYETLDDDTSIAAVYSSIKYMVASRMHASIFALSFEIPTLVVNWQHKVKGTFEQVFGDATEYLIDMDFDSRDITSKLEKIESAELEKSIELTKQKIYNQASKVIANEKEAIS